MALKHESKNVWKNLKENELDLVMDYANRYMAFLDNSKTERRCANEIIKLAKNNGFEDYNEVLKTGKIEPGTKIYLNNKEKSVALVVIGKQSLESGMNIVGSHIDAPRLDLKPFPLPRDHPRYVQGHQCTVSCQKHRFWAGYLMFQPSIGNDLAD